MRKVLRTARCHAKTRHGRVQILMIHRYDEGGQPNLSNKQMLQILLKEIPVIHRELSGDIRALDHKLSARMNGIEGRLGKVKGQMNDLSSDMKILRLEVHQNQLAFMTNHHELQKRVTVLEKK